MIHAGVIMDAAGEAFASSETPGISWLSNGGRLLRINAVVGAIHINRSRGNSRKCRRWRRSRSRNRSGSGKRCRCQRHSGSLDRSAGRRTSGRLGSVDNDCASIFGGCDCKLACTRTNFLCLWLVVIRAELFIDNERRLIGGGADAIRLNTHTSAQQA
jgi:hypothetical protein